MSAYTFYWLDGKKEVLSGSNAKDAFVKGGYGGGAIKALDFTCEGIDSEYYWNGEKWLKFLTFDAFLAYIHEHVGNYCNDGYWLHAYECLPSKKIEDIKKELPNLAINAIGTDYVYKNG